MTDYDDIPYHYAQFKASHNSYAKREPLIEQLSVESKKGEVGCRGLELDLHRTLHLDIKSGGSVVTGANLLDSYLRDYLGRERIFTPGDLMGAGTDLVAATGRSQRDRHRQDPRTLFCVSRRPSVCVDARHSCRVVTARSEG